VGGIFRRKVRVCTVCDLRLDTTAARRRCEAAGHPIEVREQRIWWIKYRVRGTLRYETSGSPSNREHGRRVCTDGTRRRGA